MKIYAAYGSNMNLEQMSRRCPEAKIVGTGMIEDYKLTFGGNGHANIKHCKGSEVPIVTWEIAPRCERALDAYEGYPRYYIKKEIIIKTKAGNEKAMVYIMDRNYENKIVTPTSTYYNIIYEGYLDNKIPVEILEEALNEVKTFISE